MKYDLIIFDLDGTLYEFKKSNIAGEDSRSKFAQEIKRRGIDAISKKLLVPLENASKIWTEMSSRYSGQVSIGLERELAIPRSDYLSYAFGMKPADYICFDKKTRKIIKGIEYKKCILSTAPRVWIDKVLDYMGLEKTFSNIWSGDGDIRKPQEGAYRQVLEYFNIPVANTLMIDDEAKNLEVAKNLGIATVLIGQDRKSFIDYNLDSIVNMETILK